MAINTKYVQLTGSDKIGLVSSLATMLAAGIPILEAVQSLVEEAKGNQKKVLEVIAADLTSGNRIFTSFEKFPKVFNKVTVNLVKASEEAGTLEITLKDLKRSIQEEMEFSDKVRSALFYPMLVMCVFVGVLGVMLVVVVPKISQVFLKLKVDLPLPTRIMIFLSDAMLANVPLFLGSLILLMIGLVVLYKRQRQVIFKVLFSLPIVSDLVRQIDLTRFCRSMYLLLSSGLPIPQALELAQDVVMKSEIQKVIIKSREMVMAGSPFSSGLKTNKKIVPGMVIKLIEVGEKTGTLDKAMQDLSEHLDYEVSKSLKTFTSMLEPLMLVVVGIAVGGMMMAIISPMYGLIGNVGTR